MPTLTSTYQNFNYFDQFLDTQVDLTDYVNSFLNGQKMSNSQPVKTTLRNIFEHVTIITELNLDVNFFYTYQIKPGDRIETVSYDIYNTRDYWWIIAVYNNIRNMFTDWPLTEKQLISLADKLYNRDHEYPIQTYYELLSEANELKRNITVPKVRAIPDILYGYRSAVLESATGITI